MSNTVLQLLEKIGFSEKEAKVYIALLSADSATANETAKKADINRTTCYDLLEVLIKKGVVSKFKKKSRTFYRVSDPRQLIAYLDREKNDFEKIVEKNKESVKEILPELISLQYPSSTRPKVQFYEGDKGMREAYEDTLTSKGEILAYANVETGHKALPNFFPDYYQRRASKKIPIKGIFPDNEVSRERSKFDQAELRQSKLLPKKELTFTPEMNIYNDKIMIASWKEKIAIIIESKEFADQQRVVYELLWSLLD